MGYFKQGANGISWLGAFRIFSKAISFGRIAILARVLSPVQFGIFGIASIVLALLEVLSETGINVFLIQEKSNIKTHLNTAWVVSIVRGILISLILIIVSKPLANFFSSPDAYPILILISLVPFIKGFINPALVTFQKELEFKKDVLFRSSVFLVGTIVTVSLALITRSTSSLIWGLIAGSVLEVVLSHLFISPTPRFNFDFDKIKKVVHRGKWMTLTGTFNYFFHQGDDMVVGKLLGDSSLGYYQVAYKISTLPITEVCDIFGRVSFPIYTKIREDKKRLRQAFFKTLAVIAGLTIPFGLILFLFASPIIKILLGDQWLVITPLLKVLSIFGIVRAISGSSSSLLLALKKQRAVSIVTLVSLIGMALSVIPLTLTYGLIGTSFSALLGSVVALPFMVYFVWKVL
ncbi:MAG: lipopolysaccharide biosynthesis protein [Candidatus Beckwithbacteria bacterium]|nr:lipopolysaccharide biosynthesis protein [Patescibacteria group bacterium]